MATAALTRPLAGDVRQEGAAGRGAVRGPRGAGGGVLGGCRAPGGARPLEGMRLQWGTRPLPAPPWLPTASGPEALQPGDSGRTEPFRSLKTRAGDARPQALSPKEPARGLSFTGRRVYFPFLPLSNKTKPMLWAPGGGWGPGSWRPPAA